MGIESVTKTQISNSENKMSGTPVFTTRLPCFWLSGNTFQNGQIETTNIDMGPSSSSNPIAVAPCSIINLHDPVAAQDAATKAYVDQSVLNAQNAIQTIDFTLTGTNATWIDLFPDRGSFICLITGKMTNGPSAIYAVSKSKSGDGSASEVSYESGNVQRINQSGAPGTTTATTGNTYVRLVVSWNEVDATSGNQQLMIAKVPDDPTNDLDLYDGQYELVLLGSDGTV